MTHSEEEDARRGAALEYFGDRMHRIFAVFFAAREFKNDAAILATDHKDYRTWCVNTIVVACMHTTLMAIRDLDDFFSREPKQDDMRAHEDFRYPRQQSIFIGDERCWIDKTIAHSTWLGSTRPAPPSQIVDLASRAVTQGVNFLKWVESHYGPLNFMVFTSALPIRKLTEHWLELFTEHLRK